MDYTLIGNRIRQARRGMKWTQCELAEKCGVSTSFIGHIERGSRKASLETMYTLCKTLSISMDSVLFASTGVHLHGYSERQRKDAEAIIQAALDIVSSGADNA